MVQQITTLNMHPYIPIYFLSFFFVFLALAVFIRRRPVMFSYKWLVLLFVVVFMAPLIRRGFVINSNTIFPLVLIPLLFYYALWRWRGIMVVGADGDDFQRVFTETLTENNYRFEQTFTSIKVTEPPMEIQVAFQSWNGSGQIRLRSKGNKEAFNGIINQMRQKQIKINMVMPVIYLVIGCLIFYTEIAHRM